jgi:mono/diheme cytochrome c family protein
MSKPAAALVCAALAAALSAPARAPAEVEAADLAAGRDLYLRLCSSCHGTAARGDGPVADVLATRPPDLTAISRRAGGAFPREALAELVDGRRELRAHGSREMPVWGEKIYAGPSPASPDVEKARRGAIDLLLLYLESIQAPIAPELPR